MTNKLTFQGVRTALVTPFNQDGSIDRIAFDKLVNMQLEARVKGILFLGTTGENPTLTSEEGVEIVKKGIDIIERYSSNIQGSFPDFSIPKVMVNIGTNSTQKSIDNMKKFENIKGIDTYLVVNPYYNKPTQTGLLLHFTEIAKHTSRPVFVYNIKGRTGVNIETDTLLKIVNICPNIVGVKEASGDINQINEVINKSGSDFVVLSGDDGLTLDAIKAGGDGVISVASNYLPRKVVDLVEKALHKNISEAEKINSDLQDFFVGQFLQTNPIPIKTTLANKGIIQEYFRLPMCPMDPEPKKKWLEIIGKY